MPLAANQLKLIDFTTTTESLESTINILRANICDKNSEKDVILTINRLLSSSKTRRIGLEIINTLIEYFSTEILSENVAFWLNNCTTQDSDKEIKLRTLEKIVKKLAGVDSFNKKFVSDFLSDTLKACLTYHSNSEKSACLRCLSQCMRNYPSWFGNHKAKIELFLLQFLEDDVDGIQDAAAAFHLFQATGSAGVEGVNYINNFRNQLRKLCATVQVLYDDFFENIHEVDNSEKIDSEIIQFERNSDNLEGIASLIFNCLTFIRVMISRGFPVEKQMVPKYIVDIVVRGLSTHICLSESNITLEKTNQSLLLNKIQLLLLQILRIYTIGNQSSLLPFSYVINKTLINLLKRINNCMCFNNYPNYKIAIYKTLNCWLSVGKNINNARFQEMLVPLLLKDITPIKKKIILNLSSSGKKKSKTATPNIETIESKNLDKDCCIYALDTLRCIFSTYQVTVDKQLIREIVSFVVKTLTEIQNNRGDPPYNDTRCQLRLYEVLIAFMKQEQKNVIPLHLVTAILEKGLNSFDCKISNASRDGLDLLEKICQPVCPSIAHVAEPTEIHKIQEQTSEVLDEIESSYAQAIQSEEENVVEIHEIIQEEEEQIVINTSVEEEKDEIASKKEITVISNVIISDSNDSYKEDLSSKINSDEPPNKKKKSDFESMFDSFQDVIQ